LCGDKCLDTTEGFKKAYPFPEEDRFPISEKVRFLSGVAAYPHGPKFVEVIETHMLWVFLAGELVYKLKKPMRYERWSRNFGPIVKVDRMTREVIRNEETKEPFG
jgi:hypothetical protein